MERLVRVVRPVRIVRVVVLRAMIAPVLAAELTAKFVLLARPAAGSVLRVSRVSVLRVGNVVGCVLLERLVRVVLWVWIALRVVLRVQIAMD